MLDLIHQSNGIGLIPALAARSATISDNLRCCGYFIGFLLRFNCGGFFSNLPFINFEVAGLITLTGSKPTRIK
jgi:hypothetical protein